MDQPLKHCAYLLVFFALLIVSCSARAQSPPDIERDAVAGQSAAGTGS